MKAGRDCVSAQYENAGQWEMRRLMKSMRAVSARAGRPCRCVRRGSGRSVGREIVEVCTEGAYVCAGRVQPLGAKLGSLSSTLGDVSGRPMASIQDPGAYVKSRGRYRAIRKKRFRAKELWRSKSPRMRQTVRFVAGYEVATESAPPFRLVMIEEAIQTAR